jgi:PAS domain S-box-containing protein
MILPDTSTILIVDDDRGGRETLEALLSTQGYSLVLASSGQDALHKLAEAPVDLVLLDIMMPGMDGYEVCRRIRNDPAIADIPVLMLTALNDYRSRLAGYEVGADDYVTKPYDSAELFARVKTITRLNRYRRQVTERVKFQQLFDFSPNGQLVTDEAGKILLTNKKMVELLGIDSASEIIDNSLSNWIAPGGMPGFEATWAAFWQKTDRDFHLETWLAGPDKAPHPVELFLGKIEFAGQHAAQVIVIDIHEQVQMANHLAREQALLKALLEILPDFVYVKDLDGRYVMANPAMARLLGMAAGEEAIGKTDFDFYPTELAMRYASDEQQLLATGKPIIGQEEPAVDFHGNWLIVSTSKLVLHDKKGDPIGIIGLAKDVTGQRTVERERDQARAEAVAAGQQVKESDMNISREKEDQYRFLADLGDQIAHLANGLSPETGQLQAGAGENENVLKIGAALLALARDLSEYSRLAQNQPALSDEEFSLKECVQNAAALATVGDGQEGLQVEISLATSLPDWVAGDRDGLSQVMARLLKKVNWQSKAGRPSILIEEENYDALKHPGRLYIHVTISAPGLLVKTEEMIDAFTPYHSPFKESGDPGLDLAICKRLVERAGGSIWIENQALNGKEVTFHFTYLLKIPQL